MPSWPRQPKRERTAFYYWLRREAETRAGCTLYPTWQDGVHPDLRPLTEDVAAELKLHGAARAVISSQVFGFALFLPFAKYGYTPLAELLSLNLGRNLTVESLVFELSQPKSVLAERGRQTAVDVVVQVIDVGSEERGMVLLEVKLTEPGFSWCNGFSSRYNPDQSPCVSGAAFMTDPKRCYLTDGKRHARRYWHHFEAEFGSMAEAFPGPIPGACPFAYDAQQTMRNHAFALGLVHDGHADFSAHGLVHHDGNTDVVGYFERYRSHSADARLFRIPASRLVGALAQLPQAEHVAEWLQERYVL